MRLTDFSPEMAEGVAACYNDLIAPVPECHPVPAAQFASLEGLAHEHLQGERLVVAQTDPGDIRGFVHVGLVTSGMDYRPPLGPGTIRFLAYRPGERAVGVALLEWAEAWAREQGCTVMTAWRGNYPYPFYYFHGGAQCSEHMAHVRALFGRAGYEEKWSELLLTWRDFVLPPLPQPALEHRLELTWEETEPRLWVRAVRGEEVLGWCLVERGQVSPSPTADDWCFCHGLKVEEPYQGQRLGTLLLLAALQEMQRAGCRHAALSTSWRGHRAILMYTNLGYRHEDRMVGFVKALVPDSDLARAFGVAP